MVVLLFFKCSVFLENVVDSRSFLDGQIELRLTRFLGVRKVRVGAGLSQTFPAV